MFYPKGFPYISIVKVCKAPPRVTAWAHAARIPPSFLFFLSGKPLAFLKWQAVAVLLAARWRSMSPSMPPRRRRLNPAAQDSADKGKIAEMRGLSQLRKAAEGARLQAKRMAASDGALTRVLQRAVCVGHA
jgi:hypothetical protein